MTLAYIAKEVPGLRYQLWTPSKTIEETYKQRNKQICPSEDINTKSQ